MKGLSGVIILTTIMMTAVNTARADEPIVGLWQVTWTDADTHNVVSKVWDVWHADRTETQNDTGPILIGNVCQGAWPKLGDRTYGLTHPAFNFLTAPGQEGQPDPNSSARVTVLKDNTTEPISSKGAKP